VTFVRKHFRRSCAAAAAGLAVGIVGPAVAADAATPGTSPGSVVQGRLYDVAAASANDVWAVGLDDNGSLIMHWNGSAWTSTSTGLGFLYNVATTGASNAWAVGGTDFFNPATLIYHWDGTAWTTQASPNPPSGGFFQGVAAASASDAWAVGMMGGGGPGNGNDPSDRTLIEHWNGSSWAVVPSPAISGPAGGLSRVSVLSPDDAWAVGWTGNGSTSWDALVEHWNGTAWTVVDVPAPVGGGLVLNAVAAVSARDVWAVGVNTAGGLSREVIVHWNGTSWKRSALPAHTPFGSLLGVAASSASNVWAVGQTSNSNNSGCPAGGCQTVTEHWNGCMWTRVPSPNPAAGLNVLWGVAVVRPGDVWAVGSTDYEDTLILHWNGTSWS
jgi:hypothetical protein